MVDGKKDGAGGEPERAGEGGDGMAALLGEAARNMAGNGAPPGGGGAAAAAVAPASATAESRWSDLAERILASRPAADGSSEVRIRVDASFLPGTEVRLVKTPDQALAVEFMVDDAAAQRLLLSGLSQLRERLSERTGAPVAVRMSEQAGSDAGDGRSRNRRNLYEELGDIPFAP